MRMRLLAVGFTDDGMASEDVARVHRDAIVVEGHRDSFEMNYLAAKGQQFPVLNVTLPRRKRANISTTFYAISGDSLTHANGTYRFLHAALQNIDACARKWQRRRAR